MIELYQKKLTEILKEIDMKLENDLAHRILCSPSLNVIQEMSQPSGIDNKKALDDNNACNLYLQCLIDPSCTSKYGGFWTVENYRHVKPIAFLIRDSLAGNGQANGDLVEKDFKSNKASSYQNST